MIAADVYRHREARKIGEKGLNSGFPSFKIKMRQNWRKWGGGTFCRSLSLGLEPIANRQLEKCIRIVAFLQANV